MKTRLLAIALGLTAFTGHLLPTPAHAEVQVVGGADDELKMQIGKGKLVRLSRPATTMFIADPKIADIQVKSPTLIYLIGKAPGSTSFYALDAREQVVANLSLAVGFDQDRLRDMLKVEAPDSKVEVAAANGALILTGTVHTAAEGDEVLRIASLFAETGDKDKPGQIINRLTIDMPNQVFLQVRIAEVSRTVTKDLGFNWDAIAAIGGSGGFFALSQGLDVVDSTTNKLIPPANGDTGIFGGYTHGPTNINAMINALQKKGLISILAEPNLTAVSGEPASFLAGGEYPIPVPQGPGQTTIEYKKYGVSLAFVATILDGGRISLNVKPEVSQLSQAGAISVGGVTVPALTTRRAETTVELGSGDSFAIAGLLQHNVTQDVQKLPWLADLPVLGQLFRSKTFERDQSELMIIVTPYLVRPSSHPLTLPTDAPQLSAAHPAAAEAVAAPAKAEPKTDPKTKG
ncbi:MAG: type II and III secretion system protein family protein [Phenylobacterium sp.]|nr:MAG: type II and III secretion system protein family protein [Phenylobacterium sp.]